MKTIIPIKLILSSDASGNVLKAIFQYKISIAGAVSGQISSISVLGSLSGVSFSSLISTAITQANISEGIS